MANHPSLWVSTLTHPLHLSPLSLSLNPHWEGEGENLEVGEDEEEGSRRTGQRLHWHPWESADPFSGNYQHQCREAMARRGVGAGGCGRISGGCGWVWWRGGGGISPRWKSWHSRRAGEKIVKRVKKREVEVERRFIFNYGKGDVSLTLWASKIWFRVAFPFPLCLVSGEVITRKYIITSEVKWSWTFYLIKSFNLSFGFYCLWHKMTTCFLISIQIPLYTQYSC